MEEYGVLMSVYARENGAWLEAAVESMLAQTVPPKEFVLVCDGPLTKELDAVIDCFCRGYPDLFTIVRLKENCGLGAALNAGLAHCRSELVARMDSDDLALPDRMELQLAYFRENPNISIVGGQVAEFDSDPEDITAYRRVPCTMEEIQTYLKRRSPMNHTTVMLRKSHVLQVGGYRNVPGFEDYLLWARMAHEGFLLGNIPQICCHMRAGQGMYARRGGLRYFRNAVKTERILLEQGIIGPSDVCWTLTARFIGAVLMPAALRQRVTQRLLRDHAEVNSGSLMAIKRARL